MFEMFLGSCFLSTKCESNYSTHLSLQLAELKAECEARDLDIKGNKAELIARLQAYLEEHGGKTLFIHSFTMNGKQLYRPTSL